MIISHLLQNGLSQLNRNCIAPIEIVDQMPIKVRQAFLVHCGKNLSYPEIAQEMGVSVSMIEKYITRALKQIREELT